MFQRFKEAIDSRIAEEQARQRQASASTAHTRTASSQQQLGVSQNGSPARRPSRQRVPLDNAGEKGPDPSEFEPEFAVGDDESLPSRAATPQPEMKEKQDTSNQVAEDGANAVPTPDPEAIGTASDETPVLTTRPLELPTEVRVKLRKVDRLENKYQELLRAYRIAHSRIQAIEPFEASLRENTPLTSISDPSALTEYLNQISLKGDMVLQELKRVSTDRDEYKKKLEESEKINNELGVELADQKSNKGSVNGETKQSETRSSVEVQPGKAAPRESLDQSTAAQSQTATTSRMPSFSLFSPKTKAKSPPPTETAEEFFSYDSELPRLESELQDRQAEIDDLKKQLTSLRRDLAVARESTEGMVQSLEAATGELTSLRDAKDSFESDKTALKGKMQELESKLRENESGSIKLQEEVEMLKTERTRTEESFRKVQEQLEERLADKEKTVGNLQERVWQKEATVKDLEDTLAMEKMAARQASKEANEEVSTDQRIARMQRIMDDLKGQLSDAKKTVAEVKESLVKSQAEFADCPSTRVFGFLDGSSDPELSRLHSKEAVLRYIASRYSLTQSSVRESKLADTQRDVANDTSDTKEAPWASASTPEDMVHSDLAVKVMEDLADADDEPSTGTLTNTRIPQFEAEIASLRKELSGKEAIIDRIGKAARDQEAMQEEIETLRDDLLHQGQEHVEARDLLKAAQVEKTDLRAKIEGLEHELKQVREEEKTAGAAGQAHQDLTLQLEELKSKSATLHTDLAAAESLAAARFKDITDLRELLSKAQPELRSLRAEVVELKSVKEDLKNKIGELNRMESRHEDLKAEMKSFGRRIGDKDAEIKALQQKIEQETAARSRVEESLTVAQSELRSLESRRQHAVDTSAQLSRDLSTAKEAATKLRSQMRDLEEQLSFHRQQVSELREELSLKSALHASSQSLTQSLRDQTHELSTQARESGTRAESLEEELAETQRMLSERTREGQTMRMLLNQAETGTEARIREMKERMDAAIEERDRTDDEASLQSRRMARDLEEARNKARDAVKALHAVEVERDDLQDRQKMLRRSRDELEAAIDNATSEVTDVKAAMSSLRDALDEAERQTQDLERQKADLRRQTDDARERVEKLTKVNKTLTDELKVIQSTTRKSSIRPGLESGVQSSRSSFDSSAANNTPRSPATNARDRPASTGKTDNTANVDYVYLKNVLLQFLEQRDKGHQKQLIPVLGMLLHFDRKDEQRWMAAISSR